jgi:TonB family protein
MRRNLCFFLIAALLLIGTQRLPAPISETQQTTPAPQPKREPISRPQSKAKTASRPKARSPLSFAGTWTGNVVVTASDGSANPNSGYVIKISNDEKTVWINWNLVGQEITGPGYQAPCNRFRETLTWSPPLPSQVVTDTLRINPNGTASFSREGRWLGGDNEGITYTHTGIVSRQSVSLPSSASTTRSAPQTTGPAASETAPNSQSNGFVALSPSGSMSGPRPEPPPEARAQHLSGQGIFLLHFDKPTGNIINVTVRQSTGSSILDQAAITTLQQWHATPGCPREVPMTITYSSSSQ